MNLSRRVGNIASELTEQAEARLVTSPFSNERLKAALASSNRSQNGYSFAFSESR
jgi:hypothetical protein